MDSGLGLRTLPRIIWVDIFSILLITLMVSSAVGKVAAGTAPFVNHAPDASAGSLDSARLYLYAGESIIKPVSGLERVAVGDPGIADVTVIEEDTLLVNGISAGYTTLMIWNSTGIEKFDVVVTARPPIDLSVVELD
jgi:Flp pilus assembly secretin CpaC